MRVVILLIIVATLLIQCKCYVVLHAKNAIKASFRTKGSHCLIHSNSPIRLFTASSAINDNSTDTQTSPSVLAKIRTVYAQLSAQFKDSLEDAKIHPFKYLSIPIAAALIGYVTNWIGVKMLFYPIQMRGLVFHRWEAQPLGLFGWQGIVPAKRVVMSTRLVDVTLSQLLNIPALFQQLNPARLSDLLIGSLGSAVSFIPQFITKFFLRRACADVILNAERVVDLRSLVVNGLTKDPTVLGAFFQRVAHKELQFLIDSGFGFGFLLGLLQMVQWMVYPKDWTLVAGKA